MEELTKVTNRLKEFADRKNLTAYGLWRRTNLSQDTVYRLYNDPSRIPSSKVLQELAKAFPFSTPNDWLKFGSVDKERRSVFVRLAENFIENLKEESDRLELLSAVVRQCDYAQAKRMVEEFDRSMKSKKD